MVNYQQYNNSIEQYIPMVRGDTTDFNFQLQGLEGEFPDTVTFSCGKKYDEPVLFACSLGDGVSRIAYDAETDTATYAVSIAHSKTSDLEIGRYLYDLQMTFGDVVITLMRGDLDLLFEITR